MSTRVESHVRSPLRSPVPWLLLAGALSAAEAPPAVVPGVSDLPPEPAAYRQAPRVDWLLDPAPFRAGVFRTPGRADEIVLANGLIRRVLRLAPAVATIALDDVVTGRSRIRAVRPEAEVTIDGLRFPVGGLVGQPDHAWIDPDWLDTLRADPEALRLQGFEVGAPGARLEWKRVRHAAPDAEWPPRGVRLRLDFAAPPIPLERMLAGPRPSGEGRAMRFEEDLEALSTLPDRWRLHVSEAHPRASFANEGKPGAIYAPSHASVYGERDLPAGTRLVEATIDAGTDRSASWGPGLALVWPGGRVLKLALRPGGHQGSTAPGYGVWDGEREHVAAGGGARADLTRPCRLRMRIEGRRVHCEASAEKGEWSTLHTIELADEPGDPAKVRVGKLDPSGGGRDFAQVGDLVRSRVLRVAAWGPVDPAAYRSAGERAARLGRLRVSVHYELYDGLPVYSKWISVHNPSDASVTVDRFTSEILAAVEYDSWVEDRGVPFPRPDIHVETDYAFGGMTHHNSSRLSVHWVADPEYLTQVNYLRQSPCLLEVRPTIGPDIDIPAGESFESFRAFVLPFDSTERERKSLSLRRMYRTIAPWVTENPLMMHVRFADPKTVRNAIDQCAEVGFEMVILTFGSGFDIENDSDEHLARMKEYADYARSKGVEIGGYSLLASRRIRPDSDNALNPETGTIFGQTFGTAPALASEWGQRYFAKLYRFYPATGFSLLEHDGSYPGDLDATARPPLQKGVKDSRWVQWRIITDFYRWCRARGVYLNVPDFYYLSGSSKCGMGYRETNWSLPRAWQVIHTRQNIFDGTWQKTPSMGWMFVPLTQYHGGGAAATIEPLVEHLDHYRRMLRSNLALGVQACYRGPRLYDTERTREMVAGEVAWFRKYRDILESDVIHGRRADGRDLDWMLHVNPRLRPRGLLVVFNPLAREVSRELTVDLYYTGLRDVARIREGEAPAREHRLDREHRVRLPVRVPARDMAWFVIE